MSSKRNLSEITTILQSSEKTHLDCSFTIDVVALQQPSSGRGLKVLNYTKDCKLKKCR